MIKIFYLLFGSVILFHNNGEAVKCSGPETPEDLRQVLWAGPQSGYQKRTRPGIAQWKISDPDTRVNFEDVPPDKVRVQLHVLSVTNIDQKRGEFQLMAWLRKRWNDPRLQYATREDGGFGCFSKNDRQGFSVEDMEEFWHPHLFLQNQIELNMNAGSLWVYSNGDVVVAETIQVTMSCAMDLNKFPHDVQNCNVLIGTWLEDAGDVILDFYDNMPPVTIGDSDITNDEAKDKNSYADGWGGSSEWLIKNATFQDLNSEHGATQKESLVQFSFEFERRSQYYVDFVIMPSVLFVVIGWASFFISRGAAPARVTMTMIAFLTNINFLSVQLNTLPRESSSIWLLKFLVVSTIFTFYTVIEYVFCNYLHRVEIRVNAAHAKARELKLRRYGDIILGMKDSVLGRPDDYESKDFEYYNKIPTLPKDSLSKEQSSTGSLSCSQRCWDEESAKVDEDADGVLYTFDGCKNANDNVVYDNIDTRTSNAEKPEDCNKKQNISHPCEGNNSTSNTVGFDLGGRLGPKPRQRSTTRLRRMTRHRMSQSSFRVYKEKEIPTTKQDLINIGFKFKLDLFILNSEGQMMVKDEHLDIFSRIAYPICYLVSAISLIILNKVR